jgi:hypothetical protein
LRSHSKNGSPLGCEGPLAAWPDEDGNCTGWLGPDRHSNVDARFPKLGDEPSAGVIAADPGDQPRPRSERGDPDAKVRGLAASANANDRRHVVARPQRPTRDDHDVQEQIPDRAEDGTF